MKNKFYSKVLLFGEYSVIKGGMGLAVPCKKYFGQLEFNKDPIAPNFQLNDFAEYLGQRTLLAQLIDIEQLKIDIKKQLYFKSNIPFGHGVGSSGALCAALFSKYSFDKGFINKDLGYLQDIMALMESYYHGTSSGLDCLISLINRPVIITSRSTVNICEEPKLDDLGFFYLFETGMSRKTAPYVHQFLKEYSDNDVFKESFDQFQNYSNQIIHTLQGGHKGEFLKLMDKISQVQLLYFANMIPHHIKNYWSQGLKSGEYFMKLCGAGGGGFFLVFSHEKLVQKELIPLN
jgi:mevalonate kinase